MGILGPWTTGGDLGRLVTAQPGTCSHPFKALLQRCKATVAYNANSPSVDVTVCHLIVAIHIFHNVPT